MLIYRVEDVNGKGPYTNGEIDYLSRISTDQHPAPWLDGLPTKDWHQRQVFGFENIQSLKTWFSDDIRHLLHYDKFVVGVYKIDARKLCKQGPEKFFTSDQIYYKNVLKGRKQLVFFREFAEHIKKIDLLSFKEVKTHE